MKYLALLVLLMGCADQSSLDKSLAQLEKSTDSLQFSIYSLQCLTSFDQDDLSKEFRSLNMPNDDKVKMLFIEAKLYQCINKKYEIPEE